MIPTTPSPVRASRPPAPGSAFGTLTWPKRLIWAKRADDEAKQALAQDASLAEAHLAIASAAGTAYGGWDWKILLERTAVALAIDPSLEFAHLARMRAFYHLGMFDAAAAAGRAAVQIESWSQRRVRSAGHRTDALPRGVQSGGRAGGAAVEAHRCPRRARNTSVWRATTPATSMERGRCSGRSCAPIVRISARRPRWLRSKPRVGGEGSAGANCGNPPRLRPRSSRHLQSRRGVFPAGTAEESIGWLERAADEGFPCYPWFERDPLLDPIRKHPRFTQLLARLQAAHRELERLQR